jgi:hypothetical protein
MVNEALDTTHFSTACSNPDSSRIVAEHAGPSHSSRSPARRRVSEIFAIDGGGFFVNF